MKTIQLAALAALAMMPLQAAWMDWTTIIPANQVQGVFTGGSGPLSGTVVATRSNINSGLLGGDPGISGATSLFPTPTFLNYYQMNNPGNYLPMLRISQNDTNDMYSVEINFSGLGAGVLPLGTLMAILDLDSQENINNMRAYDSSGNLVLGSWLQAMPGQQAFIDASADLGTGDETGVLAPFVQNFLAGAYTFAGPEVNETSSMISFRTAQDISRITFDYENRLKGFTGGGGYNIAFTNDVPEPSTYAMMGAGLLSLAYWRRKQQRS